jgi:hypothetical protein
MKGQRKKEKKLKDEQMKQEKEMLNVKREYKDL